MAVENLDYPLGFQPLNRRKARFKGIQGAAILPPPAKPLGLGTGSPRPSAKNTCAQPLVTGLAVAELAFDDAEDMLNFRPYRSVLFIPLALRGRELLVAFGLVQYRPVHARFPCRPLGLVAIITLVAKDGAVALPQQVTNDSDVVVFSGADADGVHQAAVGIDTDMGFHAKIPSVGGVYFTIRIALT
jgi:hypothetical protein